MAVAMTERDARGTIQTIGFIPNFGNSWLYLYGWQAGGEFMSADGRTCTLNSPEIVRALEFMTRIYDRLGGASRTSTPSKARSRATPSTPSSSARSP
jgi:multiple sugar transport system substrate-binding protein